MTAIPKARTFEDLVVWQKAHEWVLAIYQYTREFPKSEAHGLTAQLRRAAVSVPANMAEGFKKEEQRDKARILNIAQASLEGCRYFLIPSSDLDYGQSITHLRNLQEVSKMLDAYLKAIRRDFSSGS